ncbi:MAG: 2-amino-4-hydroxy-6-hydroxymethyldihydropteridine diphosphokinase, partial [Aeromonas sobria]
MFYLCSIGSNLDPHTHVSRVLAELLAQVGPLQLSSVIRTEPVGMQSCNHFLNCLLIVESGLDPASLKQIFVALEIAHGRDRSDPLCKVHDRPLDIDIVASSPEGDFASAR